MCSPQCEHCCRKRGTAPLLLLLPCIQPQPPAPSLTCHAASAVLPPQSIAFQVSVQLGVPVVLQPPLQAQSRPSMAQRGAGAAGQLSR